MAKRTHIVIAEPSTIIREGLMSILQKEISLTIDIAEISDLSTIATQSYSPMPDIIIINISHMGSFSPSQLRAAIGNEELKIVALQSSFVEQSLLNNYDEVLSIYDSTQAIKQKISTIIKREDIGENKKELSQREKEIIIGVVKGQTNKQIADELFLSTHTVIAHRRNIANKLQIHSPSGLTIYAIVNKLVDLSQIKNSINRGSE
ncbi:MAG: LuxR C-terminal-related transcriptional regulator [Rikenellaceae bacterium]